MKKLILPALILGATISFTSCKKDYTCDCVITSSSSGFGESTSTTTDYSVTQESNKKDAEEWCDALDATSSTITSGEYVSSTEYSCELK